MPVFRKTRSKIFLEGHSCQEYLGIWLLADMEAQTFESQNQFLPPIYRLGQGVCVCVPNLRRIRAWARFYSDLHSPLELCTANPDHFSKGSHLRQNQRKHCQQLRERLLAPKRASSRYYRQSALPSALLPYICTSCCRALGKTLRFSCIQILYTEPFCVEKNFCFSLHFSLSISQKRLKP